MPFEKIPSDIWDACGGTGKRVDAAMLGKIVDLCFLAASRRRTVEIAGDEIELQKGQLVMAQNQLARRWDMSRAAVRRLLDRLEQNAIISRVAIEPAIKAATQPAIITVRHISTSSDSRPPKRPSNRPSKRPSPSIVKSPVHIPDLEKQASLASPSLSESKPPAEPTMSDRQARVVAWHQEQVERLFPDVPYEREPGDWSAAKRIVEAKQRPVDLNRIIDWMARQPWEGWRRRALHLREFAAHWREAKALMSSEPPPKPSRNGMAHEPPSSLLDEIRQYKRTGEIDP